MKDRDRSWGFYLGHIETPGLLDLVANKQVTFNFKSLQDSVVF